MKNIPDSTISTIGLVVMLILLLIMIIFMLMSVWDSLSQKKQYKEDYYSTFMGVYMKPYDIRRKTLQDILKKTGGSFEPLIKTNVFTDIRNIVDVMFYPSNDMNTSYIDSTKSFIEAVMLYLHSRKHDDCTIENIKKAINSPLEAKDALYDELKTSIMLYENSRTAGIPPEIIKNIADEIVTDINRREQE